MKFNLKGLPLLLLLPSLANATQSNTSELQQARQLVEKAIKRFEQTDRTHWAYKVTRYESEEGDITSSVERYSPDLQAEQQWHLERINGKLPTDKQQSEFRKEKFERQKGKKSAKSFSINLSKLVQIETLQLTEQTATQVKMAFDVELEKLGSDAQNKLEGHLIYDKQEQYLTAITIVNTDAFSPMFSANIESFELNILFTEIADTVLPLEQNLNMKGTWAIFKEIDETSKDTFSEFRYVPLEQTN